MYLIYLTYIINVLCLICNSNICNDTVSSEAPVRSASLSWPSADVQDVIIINDTTQSFKKVDCNVKHLKKFLQC